MNEKTGDKPSRHVLVVDDDPIIRSIAPELLKVIDCSCATLENGDHVSTEIARAASEGRPVDLVLLDLQLGRVSGFEVCRKLRDEGIEISIVCMSADAYGADPSAFDEAGFDGVLHKPFSVRELRACVDLYAAKKQPRVL